MFKRRNPRSYSEMIYPRGGFRRTVAYLWHRVRRLPDQPHRIGRGLAVGVLVSFSPLHGLHFLVAAAISLLIRGNLLATFIGTFAGNPLTTPFIALASVGLGRQILGLPGQMTPHFIFSEFAHATAETWHNMLAIFSSEPMEWAGLSEFYHQIFLPYAIGGLVLGSIAAVCAHYLTVPIVRRHHRRREKKMAERIARLRDAAKAPDQGAQ